MTAAGFERSAAGSDRLYLAALVLSLWAVNILWLVQDTRPPVWDMALHQHYALNYVPGRPADPAPLPERSGNYPPLVHVFIAIVFWISVPHPDVAALVNIPATVLLVWAVYELGSDLAGRAAARWACFLSCITPYTFWMSRETILDYWLSAWFAAALVLLRRTEGFESRRHSMWFGLVMAMGLLTKWFFAALIALPLAYVAWRYRVWKETERLIRLADALLVAGCAAAVWYLPNLPRLFRFYAGNMQIGAREGEPPVFSYQSLIYYLRLLEGYQLFGVLFALLVASLFFVWKKGLLKDGKFLAAAVIGGWAVMTLLRTKDPRFTLPLLGLLAIVCGAWIRTWAAGWKGGLAKGTLVTLLVAQAYAVNFGISWIPQEVVLAEGYRGSLQWNWNLYLQHYFHILGAPRRENWHQQAILKTLAEHAGTARPVPALALVPDLPRFNAANFLLAARLERMIVRVDHLQAEPAGPAAFQGFDYVIMTEGDQGMPWTTVHSPALNQVIVDHPDIFRVVEVFPLPNGDSARLYSVGAALQAGK